MVTEIIFKITITMTQLLLSFILIMLALNSILICKLLNRIDAVYKNLFVNIEAAFNVILKAISNNNK